MEKGFRIISRLGSPVLIAVFLAFGTDANTLEVRASRAIDGDTFGLSVRLIGIDAPETHHPRKGREPFGQEASAFLQRVLAGKTLRLEFDQEMMDRYGRLLAYVFFPDGTFLNALLVCEGYARASPYPPNLKYAGLFRELEEEAQKAQRGLWSVVGHRLGNGQKRRPGDSALPGEEGSYRSGECREKALAGTHSK